MTLTRLIIVLLVAILISDHIFGHDDLIQSFSAKATDLALRFNDMVSRTIHRLAS